MPHTGLHGSHKRVLNGQLVKSQPTVRSSPFCQCLSDRAFELYKSAIH